MRLLTGGEAETWRTTRRLSTARIVLNAISDVGPLAYVSLADVMARGLAVQQRSDEFTDAVGASLEWLEARGDVYSVPRGRYRAMGVHAVRSTQRECDDSVAWPLFGSTSSDARWERILSMYGGALVETSVEDTPGWTVGYERVLRIPAVSEEVVLRDLRSAGLTVLDAEVFTKSLPGIEDLELPPVSGFSLDHVPGAMEAYRPSINSPFQAGRWGPMPSRGTSVLVRTSFETSAQIERRFFLHREGRFANVDRDQALFWQYRLDADARKPLKAYADLPSGELWLNGPVPSDHFRALRLLCTAPVRRHGYWWSLPLGPNMPAAREMLRSRLGMAWGEEPPPDRANRT